MNQLPPHDWDDDEHRAAIYHAFDTWFRCYMTNSKVQAHRWQMELTRLTNAAKVRKAMLEGEGV
jgi:hypothetical protein